MHVLIIISILCDKCTSSYNTHDVHELLHVSAQSCHHQGVITTNVDKPTYQYMFLFILVKIIKNVCLLKYLKVAKIHEIDSNDLQYADIL